MKIKFILKKIHSYFSIRIRLMISNAIYCMQEELAYSINNWGNLVSTTIFTIAELAAINIIYSNVQEIAGYSKNELLMFFLLGQLTFYITVTFSFKNLVELANDINTGALDLLLNKPMPVLFYLGIKKLNILSILRDSIPPVIAVLLAIDWEMLDVAGGDLLIGIVIMLLGFFCIHVVQFIAVLPVFWIGKGEESLMLVTDIEYEGTHQIPYEGFNKTFQSIFTIFLPLGISTGLAASVMLNKTSEIPALLLITIVTFFAIVIKELAWRFAIRNYTSASS
jgi:ABC-2 type transport system permease protein